MSNVHTTREGWLKAATDAMRPWLEEQGYSIPEKVLVSFGFARGAGDRAIGACYPPTCCADGTIQIYIFPNLEEPVRVLDVLLHELVHAAVGCDCGHKGPFKQVVRALGLEGKATATYAAEGSPLYAKLEELAEALGPLPHVALNKVATKRKPGGGWIKLVSPDNDEYILRISPKAIKEGRPTDPWGNEMIEVEDD